MYDRIKEDIDCVFERDPAARTVFEVVTAYPGFHAILIHRISHCFWESGFRWFGRFLSHFARWITGIEIHPGAQMGRRLFIDHGMGIVVGETSVIGDDCTLYHGVTLGGTTWQKGKRHPTLGAGVVVGAGAKILGPIKIGDNARIGSNTVVLKDVCDNATVVGIPGHVVSSKNPGSRARTKFASKIGFDAYGATVDMPDPVANAINKMLDHIRKMDCQLDALKQVLQENGIDLKDIPIPEMDRCEIESGDEA